jgi:hypothetical protein
MIVYVEATSSILQLEFSSTAVNTMGVMGRGVAKHSGTLYPDMYEAYRRAVLGMIYLSLA